MPADDLAATEALIESLLRDDEFERLEDITQPFNVFEVLGAVNQEIRHSNFLAWLLNPLANHGLGDYFLSRFLWKTTQLAREQGVDTIRPLDVDSLDLSGVVTLREWHSIDITLTNKSAGFVCAIENKVFSTEHGDQLQRYRGDVQAEFPEWRNHLIYLTPGQLDPTDRPWWVAVGYDTILEIVEGALKSKAQVLGDEVRVFLRHYADMLRRHVMSESEVENLCRRIYAKHQRALDLIFEFRLDRQSEISRVLQSIISEDRELELDGSGKSYIRFFPVSWQPYGLPLGSGWTRSRRILLFQFNNAVDSLVLTLHLGPGEQSDRQRIFEQVQAAHWFKGERVLYQKWNTVWRMDFLKREDYDREMDSTEAQIRDLIQKFKAGPLSEISEIISLLK